MPIRAPVSIAVLQTFALALVSAPITWPAAYSAPAARSISIATTGTSVLKVVQMDDTVPSIPPRPVLAAEAKPIARMPSIQRI
ncbi:Uncharacterised protein [Candidatus Gugararchaeum adminiculabundum]|nr:Uncharacterised protein [Candidatus Gugararchaeum adminiculabundum]